MCLWLVVVRLRCRRAFDYGDLVEVACVCFAMVFVVQMGFFRTLLHLFLQNCCCVQLVESVVARQFGEVDDRDTKVLPVVADGYVYFDIPPQVRRWRSDRVCVAPRPWGVTPMHKPVCAAIVAVHAVFCGCRLLSCADPVSPFVAVGECTFPSSVFFSSFVTSSNLAFSLLSPSLPPA